MAVWFNEAISDLICQSSDAEKGTEREVRQENQKPIKDMKPAGL